MDKNKLDKDLWIDLNAMDDLITDFYVADKFLEHSLEYMEALEVDKAMSSVIATRDYLNKLQGRMDTTLKQIWGKTIQSSPI